MRLGYALLLAALAIVVVTASARAEGGCVELVYSVQDSVGPGYYSYYPLTFDSTGNVNLTLYPELYSSVPISLVIYDLTSSRELASSPSLPRILIPLSASVRTPRRVGLAVYNPSASAARVSGSLKALLCGEPALAWALSRATNTVATSVGRATPTGIVDLGIAYLNGSYTSYSYNFTRARAEVWFTPELKATSYDHFPLRGSFSVQLNLNLKVLTRGGGQQIYWVQEVLIVTGSGAYVNVNIWNTTKVSKVQYCFLSPLNPASITGRGRVHYYTGSQGGCAGDVYIYASQVTPLGASAALEVALSASPQGVTVSFHSDSGVVDSVRISPLDGVSWAGFVVEPVLWEWSPLDAELVLAGRSSDYPTAVLESGAVTLKLSYFRENRWSLPQAAWSAGGNTFEKAVASVSQVVDGAARVTPGEPVVRQLWAFLVLVRTPLGTYYSTSLDISQFIVPVVDLGNGTRLVNPAVYVDGQLFNGSRVWPGAAVDIAYTRQYRVFVVLPTGAREDWVDEGTPVESLVPREISFDNGTRYVLERVLLSGEEVDPSSRVASAGRLEGVYRKQFLVTIASVNTTTLWLEAGSKLSPLIPAAIEFGNGTRLASPIVLYRNTSFSLAEAVATGPGVYRVVYRKQYLVRVTALNTTYEDWVDEGATFEVKAPSFESRGVAVLPVAYEYSGKRQSSPSVVVRAPLSVRVVYNATARVALTNFNLPALYAEVTLKCGSTSRRATLFLAWDVSLTLGDVNTANCSVEYTSTPSWPLLPALIVTITLIAARVTARKRASRPQASAVIAAFKAGEAPSSLLS
ncbi:thermopsin family protease [Infirmifilum sp. SLHALR2]